MPKLVANDIATALKKRISSGEWIENGRMPPERDLASEFGVARNTVRRAVSFLEDDGTVVRHVGRGTFLTATNPGSMAATVSRMEGTSPADMMEIRQLLEPAAASFAATNASATELNAVREAHKITSESQDMPTFEHWDAGFTTAFSPAHATTSQGDPRLMRILRGQAPWFEMKSDRFRTPQHLQRAQTVLDALLRRDPECQRAMLAHLRTVERNLLGR